MNKIDTKVELYIARAFELYRRGVEAKTKYNLADYQTVIEIAKMIQEEEHWQASVRCYGGDDE